jgi:hypothetical protein
VLHLELLSEPKVGRRPADTERPAESVRPSVPLRLVLQLKAGSAQVARRLAQHRAVAARRVVLLSADGLVAAVCTADAVGIQRSVHQFLDVDHFGCLQVDLAVVLCNLCGYTQTTSFADFVELKFLADL